MINLTIEQQEKVYLLDKLFGAMSIEQLRQFSESEEIVSKLRGDNDGTGMIQRLVDENNNLSISLLTMQNDVYAVKSDFQQLIKVLNQTLFAPTHNTDFNILKSRHYVY